MRRKNGIVIAVDGPSGAGKSTISKALSKKLGYLEIDTGAMYRGMAWLALKERLDLADQKEVERFCSRSEVILQLDNGITRVIANGSDITDEIRTPEISLLTSRVAALAPVRVALVQLQQKMGANGGVILDGRDIGTVVFPDAELKFFLSASVEERGRRRFLELKAKGVDTSLEETVKDVAKRDQQDSERELSPLKMADDAIAVDSTGLTIDEVVKLMEDHFRQVTRGKEETR